MSTEFRHSATLLVGDGSAPAQSLAATSLLMFADEAARDAAVPAPVEGQHTFLHDLGRTTRYTNGLWVTMDEITQTGTTSASIVNLAPSKNPTGQASHKQVVTYPQPYAVKPSWVSFVQVGLSGGSQWFNAYWYDATPTSFTLYIYNMSTSTLTVTIPYQWRAYGGLLA